MTNHSFKQVQKLLCIFFLFLFLGCNSSIIYQDATTINENGWNKNEIVSFDYNSEDTINRFNIIIDIRNDAEYPYRNFWLFVHSVSPDSIEYSDTLECVLADNYGRWIGKSSGSMYALPILFLSDIKFPKTGNYHFDLIQGMRKDTLEGLREIGIRIEKIEN